MTANFKMRIEKREMKLGGSNTSVRNLHFGIVDLHFSIRFTRSLRTLRLCVSQLIDSFSNNNDRVPDGLCEASSDAVPPSFRYHPHILTTKPTVF